METTRRLIKLLLTLTSVQLRFLGRHFLDTPQKRTIGRTRNWTKNGHETDKKSDKKLEKKSDNIWEKHRIRTRTKKSNKPIFRPIVSTTQNLKRR